MATGLAASPSIHLDMHHARRGAERARDLRRDLVAAGQLHLDLALARVEDEDEGDLAFAALAQAALDGADRLFVAHEDAHALVVRQDRLVEGVGRLDAGAHLVAFEPGLEDEDESAAGLEEVAQLLQPLREDDRLEM